MNYTILAVRNSESQKEGSLYPELTPSLLPVFGSKEKVIFEVAVAGLSVFEFAKGSFTRVAGSPELDGELWVTSHRVIVRCLRYDRVRWTGENIRSALIWGPGIELEDFAASKVYRRLKSRGKAMVGNLFYSWMEAILSREAEGRQHPPRLQIVVPKLMDDGNEVRLFLEVVFAPEMKAGPIAQLITQSAATFKYSHFKPDQSTTEQLRGLSEIDVLPPVPNRFTQYKFPIAQYVNVNKLASSSSPQAPLSGKPDSEAKS